MVTLLSRAAGVTVLFAAFALIPVIVLAALAVAALRPALGRKR